MFGWREPFTYLDCGACHSLQLRDVPADLARFYPPGYYSLHSPDSLVHAPSPARAAVARLLTLPGFGPVTLRLRERYPFLRWAALGRIGLGSAILDVGCGAGVLLRRFRRWGYRNLTGIDPFMANELDEPGLQLRQLELSALNGHYDLVMLHHVLEHLPDPVTSLRAAAARLAPRGRLLVRLPLAAGPLPREYGANWFNLDAPRHLVIPSREGLRHCFAAAGLRLVYEEYDSSPLTIFYSNAYQRNIAMHEASPIEQVPADPTAQRRIARLNAAREGDYGVFVLEAGTAAAL